MFKLIFLANTTFLNYIVWSFVLSFGWVLFHMILIYISYLKQVIHGHFVLYHIIVVVVDNTIRCNHDKV